MTHHTTVHVDRDGVVLEPGQKISVTHCVGPYGQTTTDTGILESIDQFGGFVLRVPCDANPVRIDRGRFGITYAKSGERFYVAANWRIDAGVFVCQYSHEDFDHGHETWAEVAL